MAAPSGSAPPPPGPEDDRGVGELVLDVSERVSILVREEVELAKAEVSEKVSHLARGAAVGIAAGVFVLAAIAMLMQFGAWGINDLLNIETAWWVGFGIMAVIFLLLAALAGFIAQRAMKKGSPPAPTMAIEEAKATKGTLGGSS
jgi:hypothetical protein